LFDSPSLKNIKQSAEVVSKFDNESKQQLNNVFRNKIFTELKANILQIKTIWWQLKII
jgi:hypothetical protein